MKDREEVAVVTGAARGIGRRVALVLAEEGFRIVANDLAAPEETLEELRSAGAKTLSVPGGIEVYVVVADGHVGDNLKPVSGGVHDFRVHLLGDGW